MKYLYSIHAWLSLHILQQVSYNSLLNDSEPITEYTYAYL